MKRLALFLPLLLCACASDGSDISQPPREFAHAPAIGYTVRELPYWEVSKACGVDPNRHGVPMQRSNGCTLVENGRPVFIVPSVGPAGITPIVRTAILAHEFGHEALREAGREDWREHKGWGF